MTRNINWFLLISVIIIHTTLSAVAKKATNQIDKYQPEYEHQIIAWPEEVDEENEGEDVEDDQDVDNNPAAINIDFTNKPSTNPKPVHVLENYHTMLPNKTQEHKLTLANGFTTYKRIEKKITRNGKVDTIQEGFYTIPLSNAADNYQTIHYKADENGYKVYTVDKPSGKYPRINA